MKCTAPCVPKCEHEATHELLNKESGVFLGYNCTEHINTLLKINDGKDYRAIEIQKSRDEIDDLMM